MRIITKQKPDGIHLTLRLECEINLLLLVARGVANVTGEKMARQLKCHERLEVSCSP